MNLHQWDIGKLANMLAGEMGVNLSYSPLDLELPDSGALIYKEKELIGVLLATKDSRNPTKGGIYTATYYGYYPGLGSRETFLQFYRKKNAGPNEALFLRTDGQDIKFLVEYHGEHEKQMAEMRARYYPKPFGFQKTQLEHAEIIFERHRPKTKAVRAPMFLNPIDGIKEEISTDELVKILEQEMSAKYEREIPLSYEIIKLRGEPKEYAIIRSQNIVVGVLLVERNEFNGGLITLATYHGQYPGYTRGFSRNADKARELTLQLSRRGEGNFGNHFSRSDAFYELRFLSGFHNETEKHIAEMKDASHFRMNEYMREESQKARDFYLAAIKPADVKWTSADAPSYEHPIREDRRFVLKSRKN